MADHVLTVVSAYGALGAIFAFAFVVRGAAIVEPSARGGSIGFRVAIVPGAIVLWPYLLVRWARSARSGGAPR